jgi:hypothetical protein
LDFFTTLFLALRRDLKRDIFILNFFIFLFCATAFLKKGEFLERLCEAFKKSFWHRFFLKRGV